jgi:hypothetical protein
VGSGQWAVGRSRRQWAEEKIFHFSFINGHYPLVNVLQSEMEKWTTDK